jgi:hypothetical protein
MLLIDPLDLDVVLVHIGCLLTVKWSSPGLLASKPAELTLTPSRSLRSDFRRCCATPTTTSRRTFTSTCRPIEHFAAAQAVQAWIERALS